VGVLMPYQVCDSCDIIYPISEDEEVFEFCRCGGNLKYYRSLLEYSEDGSEPVRKVIRLQRTYTENKAYDYRLIEIIGAFMSIIGFIWLMSGFLLAVLSVFAGIMILLYGMKEGYSWKRGLKGEKVVNRVLERLPQDYFVFYDVKLPGSKGNIDHVVIGPNGIFVIETKNYSGKYAIIADDWYPRRYSTSRRKKLPKSPGKQAKFNAISLRNFLTKNINTNKLKPWVHAIVVLIGQKPLKIITKYYTVLQPHEVIDFIIKKKGKLTRSFKEESIELVAHYSTEVSFYAPQKLSPV
jgi:hypothetical protein